MGQLAAGLRGGAGLRAGHRRRAVRPLGLRHRAAERVTLGGRRHAGHPRLPRERLHGEPRQQVDPAGQPEPGAVRAEREDAQHARPQEHGGRLHPGGGRHSLRRRAHPHRDGLQEAPDAQAEAAGARPARGRQVEGRHRETQDAARDHRRPAPPQGQRGERPVGAVAVRGGAAAARRAAVAGRHGAAAAARAPAAVPGPGLARQRHGQRRAQRRPQRDQHALRPAPARPAGQRRPPPPGPDPRRQRHLAAQGAEESQHLTAQLGVQRRGRERVRRPSVGTT
ncbi:hypothetical protein FOCC_FOCC002544 [Frankliniella occidentalis]|nr:hypothetical protein FOCC_FOCC002544 [Frankliniella occidentalis]